MALDFDKFAAKGKEFINALAKDLGYPDDTARAGRVLRAILHVLRDQLTVEEAVQLLAQLPMALKAVFVDQWAPSRERMRLKHIDDFLTEVKYYNPRTAHIDFPSVDSIENSVAIVFRHLHRHVSLGELEDIRSVLPKELKQVLRAELMF